MNMAKRFSSVFLAFALCAVMSLGSLSFMPNSFALGHYVFPFDERTIPSPPVLGNSTYSAQFVYSPNGTNVILYSVSSDSEFKMRVSSNRLQIRGVSNAGSLWGSYWSTSNNSWTAISGAFSFTSSGWTNLNNSNTSFCIGTPFFISSSFSVDTSFGSTANFTYEFSPEPYSKPVFSDYSPFYFPELPHGYFDGNINVVDGQYSVDLGSVTGTTSNSGDTTTYEHYSFVVPYYKVTSDSSSGFDFNDTTGIGHFFNSDYTSGNYTVTGQSTNTIHYVESGSFDINGSAPVLYTPAYNENSRFRCWSCVMDSSYVWFVSDTRNKITGSIVSVTSDEVSWKYEFADPLGGNIIYPIWAIVFSPMGEVIQVLSASTVANKNTYTLSCSIGTLEQDQDTGIWSCDPLYHGFWFSNDSPPVANITHLNVSENKKYLANPVFGESAFQLHFLDSINRGIADINSNIQSLQSAMQSSISGQTSAFQNMDAPSAPQPSTSQMMDYFSQESAFSAPNTDDVFSGDIKSGHYWDGVTWWSSKFNDIIVSNQVIVAFTTAMLTLGLAVLIIGRRFSMR